MTIFRLKLDKITRDYNLNCYMDEDNNNNKNNQDKNINNKANNTTTNINNNHLPSNWVMPFSHVGTFTYLGGVDNTDKLSWLVWNRENDQENQFFRGCIRSVRFSGGSFQLKRNQSHSPALNKAAVNLPPRLNDDENIQNNHGGHEGNDKYADNFDFDAYSDQIINETPYKPPRKPVYQAEYYDDFGDYEKPLDLIKLARDQNLKEMLMGCIMSPELCVNSPCQNEGVCINGMGSGGMQIKSRGFNNIGGVSNSKKINNNDNKNGAFNGALFQEMIYKICDCSSTAYTGLYCDSGCLEFINISFL